jgi:hypothetical protein
VIDQFTLIQGISMLTTLLHSAIAISTFCGTLECVVHSSWRSQEHGLKCSTSSCMCVISGPMSAHAEHMLVVGQHSRAGSRGPRSSRSAGQGRGTSHGCDRDGSRTVRCTDREDLSNLAAGIWWT